jgi:hypothetical protein
MFHDSTTVSYLLFLNFINLFFKILVISRRQWLILGEGKIALDI